MKRWILLAGFLVSSASGSAATRPWRVFFSYDYYSPANSGDGIKTQLQNQSDTLIAAGYDSTSYNVDSKGGEGARIGLLYPWGDRTKIGASLGYVLGPTINSNFNALSVGFGNGGETISRAVSYYRLLGTTRLDLFKQERWTLGLATSAGVGVGRVDQSCTASGSLTCTIASASATWAGFTWEFSPMVSYRLRAAEIDGGLRYAGFPKFKGNDNIAAIDWQSLGIFLGATF